jgi:ferredoxin-thioredoxin reductase catalytic chain
LPGELDGGRRQQLGCAKEADAKKMGEQHSQDARERVERMVHRYTKRGPCELNPDPVTLEYVVAGLTRNLLEHGRWYCPCREVTGDPERDRKNICPCPQHKADIDRDGVCECGIFVSAEYARTHGAAPTSDPGEEN